MNKRSTVSKSPLTFSNHNLAILGHPGTGKSVLTIDSIIKLRNLQKKVIIFTFDDGRTYFKLIKKLGGIGIDVAAKPSKSLENDLLSNIASNDLILFNFNGVNEFPNLLEIVTLLIDEANKHGFSAVVLETHLQNIFDVVSSHFASNRELVIKLICVAYHYQASIFNMKDLRVFPNVFLMQMNRESATSIFDLYNMNDNEVLCSVEELAQFEGFLLDGQEGIYSMEYDLVPNIFDYC